MGFTVPTSAKIVNIQGTRVVPEFPISITITMMIGFVIITLGAIITRRQ
ncbi:MAG: hypothetical protein PXX83_07770 [Candidatus Nitrosotalea sp.]|nr:hypothetical protein [Candidatus Nitrosotalea sp.]